MVSDHHSTIPRGPADPMRVIVLSRVRVYGHGLRQLLGRHPTLKVDIDLIGPSDGTPPLISDKVDVVLIDSRTMTGPSVVHSIRASCRGARIVTFGIEPSDGSSVRCAQAGVEGFVSANASVEESTSAIESSAHDPLTAVQFKTNPHGEV